MAHKSLIGGTVYEKSGGTDLINGTVYEKDYGKTLIGGTAYEVGFAKPMATVTIADEGYPNYYYVSIDGVVYTAPTKIEVPAGTEIYCYTMVDSYDDDGNPLDKTSYGVRINGIWVGTTYTYEANCNIFIDFGEGRYGSHIAITEIPEGYALVSITGSKGAAYRAACDVTIDGVACDIPSALAVPLGTVITCTAYDNDKKYSCVRLNGQIVVGRSANATYNYTVIGNVTINCKQDDDDERQRYSEVTITEQ